MIPLPLLAGAPASSPSPAPAPRAKRKPKPAADTAWVDALVADARKLAKVPISRLDPDARLVAARYHCLKFANCTLNEGANRRQATKVAAAFASMGRNKTYGDMTFGEYVAYAKRVHAGRDAAPWFDVWLIRSVVEFGDAE